jgi:hypothetical protein
MPSGVVLSSLRVTAELDAGAYARGADQKVAADQRMVDSGNKVAGAVEQTERRLGTSGTALERLTRSIDPAYRATAQFEAGQRTLQRALDSGAISAEEHGRRLELLSQRYGPLITGGIAAAGAVSTLATVSRGTGQDLEKLAEAHEHVAGSSRRTYEGMVLVHEFLSGNYRRAIGSGTIELQNFGAMQGIVAAAMNPLVLAATAVVGAFALIAYHASNDQAQLRQFDAILKGMGTSSDTTAAQLQAVVRQLRDTGTAANAAEEAVKALARVQGINPGSAGTLLPLARDISTATGDDLAKTATRIAAAFATSTEAAIKLVFEIAGPDGLTVAEAANMRTMAEHGDRAGALGIAVSALSKRFGGEFQDAMSESAKAATTLSSAWNHLLESLAQTTAFTTAKDALTGLVNAMGNVFSGQRIQGAPGSPVDLYGNPTITQPVPASPTTPGITSPGASNSLDTRGLNVNTDALQRLTTVLDAAVKQLPPGYGLVTTSTVAGRPGTPGSYHPGGEAIDVQLVGPNGPIPNRGADTTGLYEQLAAQAYLQNQQLFPGTSLAWGGRFGVAPGSNVADLMHFDAGPDRGTLRPPLSQLAAGLQYGPPISAAGTATPAGIVSNAPSQEDLNRLKQQEELFQRNAAAAKKFGDDELYAKTYAEALATSSLDGNARIYEAEQKASQAVELHRIELQKQSTIQDLTTKGVLATAEAFGKDEVAGLQAAALAQARLAVVQGQALDVGAKYTEILRNQAAEAINAAARALPGLIQQTAATERLADAAIKGAGAEHDAELQNQASAATHDALAKAIATGDQALVDQAKALTDVTLAQIKANDAAKVRLDLQNQNNQGQNSIDVMRLEVSLQGQTTEEIQRQVALLQEKQRLDALGASVTQQERDNRLAVVDAVGRQNIALAEAQRAQQRLDDGVRQIADTVDNTLVKAMQDAFDGKKVTDWGATLKSVVSQILSGILNFALIRPAIGSVVGALGFGNVASQFGSFGGIGGTSSTSGGLNTGSLLQGGGLLKDLFGGSSSTEGGLFGGVNNFLNNTIGANLGFAGSGIVNGTGAGAGIFTNLATGATSDVLGSGVASGLFGGTTFSGFLGGAGLGFGAGSLLNSLIGGNTLGGTVGSGLGSLAGAAIGSIVPGIGTLIGGLLGGAGGGLLGGLFGNNRPANNESAGGLNLATGQVTSFSSHGVAANDQAVQQFLQPLQTFISNLLQVTGGQLQGTLGFQAGSRDGSKLMYNNVPGFGSGELKITDIATQLPQLEQILTHALTGISDTLKTVLDHVTDPSQIQAAVQFAAVYDKLKEAAQDDFKAIDAAIGQADKNTGPFAQAMQQLTTTFGTLHDQAVQFGLSVDVVDRSLARATQHLQQDFQTALNQAFNQASNQGFVNDLQTAVTTYEQNINEAIALGLGSQPSPTVDRIVALFDRQINTVLGQLTPSQLDTVIANFTDLESSMQGLSSYSREAMDAIIAQTQALRGQAQATQGATTAAQDAAAAAAHEQQLLQGIDQQVQQYQQTFGAAFRQIHDFVLSLQTAVSPFTSPESRLHAAQSQYQALLAGAQGGDLASLQQISGSAQTYLQTIGQYYASSAAGQALFALVNAQLSALGGGGPGPGKPTIVNDPNIQPIDTSLKTLTAVTVAAGDTAASQGEQTNALLTQIVAAVSTSNQSSGFTSTQTFTK